VVLIRRRPWWQQGAATAAEVAKSLNALSEAEGHLQEGFAGLASIVEAWRWARDVLEPSVDDGRLGRPAAESIARFNTFAAEHPVTLQFSQTGAAVLAGDGAPEEVIYLVWSHLFGAPAQARLKRCSACARWFADETRNRSQRWCSETCHNRGWNRAARRGAKHRQYRTRKTKTGRRSR
jgi:predicted RNA-binding Zn ribbon-like protein